MQAEVLCFQLGDAVVLLVGAGVLLGHAQVPLGDAGISFAYACVPFGHPVLPLFYACVPFGHPVFQFGDLFVLVGDAVRQELVARFGSEGSIAQIEEFMAELIAIPPST